MGKIRQIRPVQRKTAPSFEHRTSLLPRLVFACRSGLPFPQTLRVPPFLDPPFTTRTMVFRSFSPDRPATPLVFSLLFAQVGVPNKIPKTKTGDFPLMCTHTAKKTASSGGFASSAPHQPPCSPHLAANMLGGQGRDHQVGNHASNKGRSTVLHVLLSHRPVPGTMRYHIPRPRQFVCPSQILPTGSVTLVVPEPFARAALVMSVVGPPPDRCAGMLQ